VPQILANPSLQNIRPDCNPIKPAAWEAPAALRLWHLASLDAPTVAVVWAFAFAWIARVRLPVWAAMLLALVAWVVYVGDRLLDAHAGLQTPPLHYLLDRHYFHWRHRRLLLPLAVAAAAASAWMVLTKLPAGARVPDSAIAAATLVYFSGVHARIKLPPIAGRLLSPFLSKEFAVGILFTAGCLLPVWSQTSVLDHAASRHLQFVVPGLYFAVLAWLNCFAIAQWELPQRNIQSIRVRRIGYLIAIAGAMLTAQQSVHHPRVAALMAAGVVSALLLSALDALRPRMTALTLRAMADFVLLTPLTLALPGLLRQ
jgi:hypothetical protein